MATQNATQIASQKVVTGEQNQDLVDPQSSKWRAKFNLSGGGAHHDEFVET